MDSPVPTVVAKLYMEFFEKLVLEMALTRPRLWMRYVDDTFCILRKNSAEELLQGQASTSLWSRNKMGSSLSSTR